MKTGYTIQKLIIASSFTLLFLLIAIVQTFSQNVFYTESFDDIMNPDRGFYYPYDSEWWYAPQGVFTPLDESILRTRRIGGAFTPGENNGIQAQYSVNTSIILRHFILDDFRFSDISNDFLNKIETDFNTARNAGVRIVLRFSYVISPTNGNCSEGFICPPYKDAPKNWVLRHIEQLKPLLRNHEDVIMTLQSGFIGVWGEQYYTDYFGDASSNGQTYLTTTNWNDRIDVLKALLDAVPQSRMVQVRYPQMKQKFVQRYPSYYNRIGFQNDCFLSSETDVGTYVGYDQNDQSSLTELRNYANNSGDFVVVGGETCGNFYSSSSAASYNNCESSGGNAVTEMELMNYSFLNCAYNYEVNNDWANNCIYEIKTRLGYRLVLNDGQFPELAQQGEVVNFSLNLNNKGFAAPFNKRTLFMLLKNNSNNTFVQPIEVYGDEADIRTWQSGNRTVSLRFNLPQNLSTGDYSMYLHIADLSNGGVVRNNPAYSIRLANENIWDANTGYNNLNRSISVVNTPSPPPPPSDDNCISIDGNFADWQNIVALTAADNSELSGMKVADDNDNIYIHLSGTLRNHYQIFLDTDGNRFVTSINDQEYLNSNWQQSGFNYMIENGSLVRFISDNPWNWEYLAAVQQREVSNGLELIFPKYLLSNLSYSNINIAANTLDANWNGSAYLPASGNFGAGYELYSSNPCVQQNACILIDGDSSDWQNFTTAYSGASNLNNMKIADNEQDILLLIEGNLNLFSHTPQIFFDTDNNATGNHEFKATDWSATGFNYMMEYNTFYKYRGDGNSWNWQNLGQIERNLNNSNTLEFKIPKSIFQEQINSNIKVAGYYYNSNWSAAGKIPSNSTAGVSYSLGSNNACIEVVQKTENESELAIVPTKYTLQVSQEQITTNNTNKQSNQNCITVDGNADEWNKMGTYGYASSGSLTYVKVADNSNEILFYLEGGLDVNNQIYLNTDVNNAALNRYNISQWEYAGFNYLVENNQLFAYTGDGESWSWSPVGNVSHAISDNILEVAVQKNQLTNLSGSIAFSVAGLNTNFNETGAIPSSNSALNYLLGTKDICSVKPACLTVNGDLAQWLNINDAAQQVSAKLQSIKISDGSESLYILLEGNMDVYQQVFIDSDNDAVGNGEYTDSNWSLTGFNYLIDEGDLFIYQGDGTSWDWAPIGAVNMISSKYWVELSVKKYLMGNITDVIQVAASSFDANWSESSFIPPAEKAVTYTPSTNSLSLFFHQNGINFHQAYQNIESSANLLNSTSNETYKAGQAIQLNSGFNSPTYINFDAYIENCE